MAALEALRSLYASLDSGISSFTFSLVGSSCGLDPLVAPALKSLPLIQRPTDPVLLVSAYVAASTLGCLVIRALGLKPREKEHPLLFAYVLLHNLVLFALSSWLFVSIPLEAISLKYKLWGNAYRPRETRMAWLIYLFYVSKYAEFGDTLIMLLRRSVRQVSFLHVYHHATITLIWWCTSFYAPGGEAYFSATLNSGVHVAMYGYYFLAALIGKSPKLRAKYLFWGRYLTQLQMMQFVAMLSQAIYNYALKKPYPLCLSFLLLVYMWSLLALFAHFYVMKYISPKQSGTVETHLAKKKLT